MTALLVSVRDAAEARAALSGGAALIDVKEPNRGSLGAADCSTIADVLRVVDVRVPVSAALGELRALESNVLGELPAGLSYAKLGLSGCQQLPQWQERWRRWCAQLPADVQPVAVIYADRAAQAPPVEEVLQLAAECGCAAALVDTFDKSGASLLAHWSLQQVADMIAACRAAGMMSVLAGSLQAENIGSLLPLAPDWIAVRGAVCAGPRTASVKQELVRQVAAMLKSQGNRRSDLALGA